MTFHLTDTSDASKETENARKAVKIFLEQYQHQTILYMDTDSVIYLTENREINTTSLPLLTSKNKPRENHAGL